MSKSTSGTISAIVSIVGGAVAVVGVGVGIYNNNVARKERVAQENFEQVWGKRDVRAVAAKVEDTNRRSAVTSR